MIHYELRRNGEAKANVVTLPNGKCIVSWPTSTIVYDSEHDARKVHIDHMGGRGDPTEFVVRDMSPEAERGWSECYQDRCDGIPLWRAEDDWCDGGRTYVVLPPPWIPDEERAAFALGYTACAYELHGVDWQSMDSILDEAQVNERRRQDARWRKTGTPTSIRKEKTDE